MRVISDRDTPLLLVPPTESAWREASALPEPGDEAILYVPPARSHMPRQAMLLTMLAITCTVLLIIVVGVTYILSGPTELSRGHGRSGLAAEIERLKIGNLPPAPPVEDVQFLDVSRDAAREINAAVPFVDGPNPAAAPLRLQLAPLDQARATDCLAAAVWYEAGDDAVGQQSVAQTVINRMRHPSFPNTVCGVVFQGSQRTTGCQFTFTCDGAMARRMPSPAAWERARAIASMQLNGGVFTPIGWATHYHTDWVVPNWSSSVDKVAKIETHLFFRWHGASGRPLAFHRTHAGTEPVIPQMQRLSPAHSDTPSADAAADGLASPTPPPDTNTLETPSAPAADLRGNALASANNSSGLYVVQIKPGTFSGGLALMALDICKGRRGACSVVGYVGQVGRVTGGEYGRVRWTDKTPDFYYFSDSSRSREMVYWNCATFPRPDSSQCMPTNFQPAG